MTPSTVDPVAGSVTTPLETLARFAAEATLAPSTTTTHLVRDALIDTLGCIYAGAHEAVAAKARRASATTSAGAPVYGTTSTAAPATAAFLNAVAGHALEFDDWEIPGNTHPSVVMFPAMLAVTAGRPVPGRDFVEAYIVGYEAIARLGEATNFEHYERGWHTTATLGPIGATAAVARLRAYDRETTTHALSIAVTRAAGYTCQFGSDTKALQAGFAAETGVIAADLAAAGLTGQPHVLEAPGGFNALMAHGDAGRFAQPFERLGDELALEEHGLVVKPYPSCGYTHRVIDCARELHVKGPWGADEIARIVLTLPDFHADILPFRIPRDSREARFSLPFCAAVGLTRGDLTTADFDKELWRDASIDALMRVTEVRPFRPNNPLLNYDPQEPDTMCIELGDGSCHKACVSFPSGAPQNPLRSERLLIKFQCNLGLSVNNLETKPSAALERLLHWPDESDVHAVLSSIGATE